MGGRKGKRGKRLEPLKSGAESAWHDRCCPIVENVLAERFSLIER